MIHTIDGISQTVQYQGCVIPYSWEPRMNGRIEELKQQASDYVDSIDNGIDIEEYRKLLDQKFAELIVQEMLETADAHTEVFQTDRDKAVIEHIKQSVKTHFGVEE
jgi:hypothetical protein